MVEADASSDTLTPVGERYFIDPGTITSLDGVPFIIGIICIHIGRSLSFAWKNNSIEETNIPLSLFTKNACAKGSTLPLVSAVPITLSERIFLSVPLTVICLVETTPVLFFSITPLQL